MKKENELICVSYLSTYSDAHILRGLLEVEDITVFVLNEGLSSLAPAYAAIVNIELHIPLAQKEKAEPIIKLFFDNLKLEIPLKCSNCDSTKLKHDYIEHIKYIIHGYIATLFFAVNVARGRRLYKKCLDCGYRY